MENPFWFDSCAHNECPPGERLECCSQEAEYAQDEIMEVVDQLDGLIEARTLESNS